MNRRQFLTFTSERVDADRVSASRPAVRVVELSCERLYMQLLDAELTSTAPPAGCEYSPYDGEPPASFHPRDPTRIFDDIERDLAGADVLRVTDRSWLSADPLSGRLDALIRQFREAGGRVDIIAPLPPTGDDAR
jgi:hypothetical protein